MRYHNLPVNISRLGANKKYFTPTAPCIYMAGFRFVIAQHRGDVCALEHLA
jgi:hypothetical protein